MAAIAGIVVNDAAAAAAGVTKKSASDSGPKQGTEFTMQKLVDMFTKLNPSAKEFFPSHHSNKAHPNFPFHPNANFILAEIPAPKGNVGIDFFPSYRRAMVFLFPIALSSHFR